MSEIPVDAKRNLQIPSGLFEEGSLCLSRLLEGCRGNFSFRGGSMRYLKNLGILALMTLFLGHSFAQPTDSAAQPGERAKARNPFSLPEGVYLSSKAPVEKMVEKEEEFGFFLQAIVIGNKQKVATINNQNFNEGDLIFSKKILKIKRNQVILRDEVRNEDIVLTLGTIPFPIWVRRGF